MKRVTIKDIARVADVSYATVSRALSGSPEISEATREHVLKICRDMGYTTNYIARAMVKKKTELIGLIVSDISNPFMSELGFYMEQRARELGYNLIFCNSNHDAERERQVFEVLVGRQVDGIILVPCSSESYGNVQPYLGQVPTVFVSENLRDVPESYVAIDNFKGTYAGVEYLYGLGHRNILYFGRRKSSMTHQHRSEGYIAACRDLGIEPQFCNSSYAYSSMQHGYQLAKALFQKPINYTAIFAAADSVAIGIMGAAEEAGIRIPEDISLLGFDNIPDSGLPRINLTTIEQPKKSIASIAVDILAERINDPAAGYAHRILLPQLVERSTCRRITDK